MPFPQFLSEITIPEDAGPSDPRIYIGSSGLASLFNRPVAILYNFDTDAAFIESVENDGPDAGLLSFGAAKKLDANGGYYNDFIAYHFNANNFADTYVNLNPGASSQIRVADQINGLSERVGYYSATGTIATIGTVRSDVLFVDAYLDANIAYDFEITCQVSCTATADFLPQLARPDHSALIDIGRQEIKSAGDRFYTFKAGFRTQSNIVSPQLFRLYFTGAMSTGTLSVKGFTSGPVEVTVKKIGAAADMPGRPYL